MFYKKEGVEPDYLLKIELGKYFKVASTFKKSGNTLIFTAVNTYTIYGESEINYQLLDRNDGNSVVAQGKQPISGLSNATEAHATIDMLNSEGKKVASLTTVVQVLNL